MHLKAFLISAFATILLSFMGCHAQKSSVMKQTTTTDKSMLDTLGLTFVSALDIEQDKVFLGLAPYARYFHLNLTIKNAKDYLYLLEEYKKTGLLLKVYLFPQTNEVAFIEKASEEEMKEYDKHRIIKVEPDQSSATD